MDNYPEKVEKKTAAYKGTLSALFDAYKSSRVHLYSVSTSSVHAGRFSTNLKRVHREEMIHMINEFFDTEDREEPTVPSPVFPLGVASSSQAAFSQDGPSSADLSIAVSKDSPCQHQLASSISVAPLPTVPVSAHPINDVNLELSGHMMNHLQFASGSASHTDNGESGNSTATVANSNLGQVQSSAGQVGDMTANQEGEEAINALVSENHANVVDVPAHSQQRATVPTAVIPNVHAQTEMATAGNSNANPNIDNVSVKKEIESPSPTLVSNYNYEEDIDSESVKEEDTDYTSQRCIDVSSDDEEENVEQQVTNAEEQIQNANSGPAIQAGGAPLTTTVTKAGDGGDTSSDDDDDSVSVKSENTSGGCECESDCDSHSGDIEIKEEEDAEAIIDEELAHEAADNEPVQPISTGDFVSLPSTSSGHRRSTRPKKQVNYTAPMDDSFARKRVNFIRKNRSVPAESESSESSDDEEFVGQQNAKRKGPSSGAATKRAKHSHVVQQSTVAAARPSVRDEPPKLIIKSLNCPQAGCNTVCPDKTSLNGHLLLMHNIGKYRCVLAGCTASFNNKFQLKDHRIGHGNLSDWPCGICSSSYSSYSNLSKHHYHVHQEGLFECSVDDCDFKWTNRCKVYNHLSYQHTR